MIKKCFTIFGSFKIKIRMIVFYLIIVLVSPLNYVWFVVPVLAWAVRVHVCIDPRTRGGRHSEIFLFSNEKPVNAWTYLTKIWQCSETKSVLKRSLWQVFLENFLPNEFFEKSCEQDRTEVSWRWHRDRSQFEHLRPLPVSYVASTPRGLYPFPKK